MMRTRFSMVQLGTSRREVRRSQAEVSTASRGKPAHGGFWGEGRGGSQNPSTADGRGHGTRALSAEGKELAERWHGSPITAGQAASGECRRGWKMCWRSRSGAESVGRILKTLLSAGVAGVLVP
jgi:hypothetical protein